METKSESIGYMNCPVNLTHQVEVDRFYIRMFINHMTGCKGYQFIPTLSVGTLCDTYKEAARRRGL